MFAIWEVNNSKVPTLQSLKNPAGRKSQNPRLANFFPGKIPIPINKISSYPSKDMLYYNFFCRDSRNISRSPNCGKFADLLFVAHYTFTCCRGNIKQKLYSLPLSLWKVIHSSPILVFEIFFYVILNYQTHLTSRAHCYRKFLLFGEKNYSPPSHSFIWHFMCDQQCKPYPGLTFIKIAKLTDCIAWHKLFKWLAVNHKICANANQIFI